MFTKTGIHAVRALAELARLPEGQFAGAAAIARTIDAPPNYLSKLLQTLAQAGLVESQKGLGGGFRLARPPAQITLRDAVEPFEHIDRWTGCILGNSQCSEADPCPLHQQWKAARAPYLQFLEQTTLADVLGKKRLRGRFR
jgi:Rrf2 family protein